MSPISQQELDHINAKRRERGLPPLTMAQAIRAREDAEASQSRDSGFDFIHFLIAVEIASIVMDSGIGGGSVGEKSDTFQGGGGDAGGAGASGSYTPDPAPTQSAPDNSSDSSSSSSDSGSSSSSSDSGSSGGDSGGGGGGGGDS